MGKVTVVGGKVGMEAPSTGILASDIAVGSTVKLMENGSPVEYLVVNQGIPSESSLYDVSCDGTWLLRKDVKEKRKWDSSDNDYKNSDIHAYLNGDFFALLSSETQSAIKQVKIPYVNGTAQNGSVVYGANGLPTKVFLLGCYEIGYSVSDNSYVIEDGAKLDYFAPGETQAAKTLRRAYLNGTDTQWWVRCPPSVTVNSVWLFGSTQGQSGVSVAQGVRPALILPFNALFDETTLVLKGVK